MWLSSLCGGLDSKKKTLLFSGSTLHFLSTISHIDYLLSPSLSLSSFCVRGSGFTYIFASRVVGSESILATKVFGLLDTFLFYEDKKYVFIDSSGSEDRYVLSAVEFAISVLKTAD